jgi:hypothetical protein
MARVEIAAQGWGWVSDRHGEAMIARVTINGSVYPTSSGGSPIATLTTRFDGTIPGWIDPGTYTLSVDGGTTRTVEAVSGTGSGGGTSVTVQDEGSALTVRTAINFTGAGVVASDNAGAGRTDVTIAGGSSGYTTVQDEGSARTQRATLNFIGAGVSAVDNAGSARTDVTITGGASASLPWVNAADYGFAQGASASAIRTSLVNAIIALPSGRGTIVLPDADVTIDLSAGAVNIGTSIVRLVGGGRTRIKCSNEGTTAGLTMFALNSTGGELKVEGVRLEGPDVLGSGGTIDLIAVGSAAATGKITAIDCELAKYSYALRVSSSVNWIGTVTALRCKIDGYGSSTQFSTGILVNTQGTGATGRMVRIVDCEFRNFGQTGQNLFHGMYIPTDWDVEVCGCHFFTSVGTGYCIQIYDGAATSIVASTHQQIIGNHFYAALTAKGVVAANRARPLIMGNTFDLPSSSIIFTNGGGTTGGGGEIINNWFTASLPSQNVIDLGSAAGGDQGVVIRGNRFTGSASRIINFQNGYWTIADNTFELSSAAVTAIDAVGAFTRLTVRGNTFRGSATQWIHVEAAGTTVVQGNYFWETTGTAYRNSSTATVQRIVANDFSQVAGSGVLNSSTPTTYQAKGNYGSVGLADV